MLHVLLITIQCQVGSKSLNLDGILNQSELLMSFGGTQVSRNKGPDHWFISSNAF